MMSRSAPLVGLMAALLGGKAVVMPVSWELPSTQAVCPVPGGMALQAATVVYSEATESGSALGEGRGAVGELRFALGELAADLAERIEGLDVGGEEGLARAVGELGDPPAQVGPEDAARARGLLAPLVARAFQMNQSPSLKP